MERDEERRYRNLSPFELKNKLVELASDRGERTLLNAARGNPNWIALEPRHAFMQLGVFALEESARHPLAHGFGRARLEEGLERRFAAFAARHSGAPGLGLLRRSLSDAAAHAVAVRANSTFLSRAGTARPLAR